MRVINRQIGILGGFNFHHALPLFMLNYLSRLFLRANGGANISDHMTAFLRSRIPKSNYMGEISLPETAGSVRLADAIGMAGFCSGKGSFSIELKILVLTFYP